MDEGAGEPVGEEGGEGAPEGGGVVEVGEVGDLVGEGLFEDGLGPVGEAGVEANLPGAHTLAEGPVFEARPDNQVRGAARQAVPPPFQQGVGACQQGRAAVGLDASGHVLGVRRAFAGHAQRVRLLHQVVIAGEGHRPHGQDASKEQRLTRARQVDGRRTGGGPSLFQRRGIGGIFLRGDEDARHAFPRHEVEDAPLQGPFGQIGAQLPKGPHTIAAELGDRRLLFLKH